MASIRKFCFHFSNLINTKPLHRLTLINCDRSYSVFPKSYIQPTFDKNVQKEMEESGEMAVVSHLPVRPAFTNQTSSEFNDPIISKFINYLTKKGKKERARDVFQKAFEYVKRLQLERYHKAAPEQQAEIELDPKKILYNAIENATPVLELMKVKRGGLNYMVPIPLTDKRSRFLAMNWLIKAATEKPRTTSFSEKLAYELINASDNTGRVVTKKQELYRQCEANRSYAHFRWT